MNITITEYELDIIKIYKDKIQEIKTAQLDADSMRNEGKQKMAIAKDKEVQKKLNDKEFYKIKENFQETLIGLKKKITDKEMEHRYPNIINYHFAHGAESAYGKLREIEMECQKTKKHKKIA